MQNKRGKGESEFAELNKPACGSNHAIFVFHLARLTASLWRTYKNNREKEKRAKRRATNTWNIRRMAPAFSSHVVKSGSLLFKGGTIMSTWMSAAALEVVKNFIPADSKRVSRLNAAVAAWQCECKGPTRAAENLFLNARRRPASSALYWSPGKLWKGGGLKMKAPADVWITTLEFRWIQVWPLSAGPDKYIRRSGTKPCSFLVAVTGEC